MGEFFDLGKISPFIGEHFTQFEGSFRLGEHFIQFEGSSRLGEDFIQFEGNFDFLLGKLYLPHPPNPPSTHLVSHPTMIYNLPGRILAGNTFLKILYFFVVIVMFCKCRIDSLATGVETV